MVAFKTLWDNFPDADLVKSRCFNKQTKGSEPFDNYCAILLSECFIQSGVSSWPRVGFEPEQGNLVLGGKVKTSARLAAQCVLIFVASTIANFGAFIFNYRLLAFPYLPEEQRVANADQILTTGIFVFGLAALFTVVLAYWTLGRRSPDAQLER